MAKYGFDDLVVEFDDAGGSLTNITQHVLTINGVNVEDVIEESHGAGDAWAESLFVGLSRMQPVVLGGNYDDATNGPNAILNRRGATGTLRITWGGTKTTQVECNITRFSRIAQRGSLTKYEAELTPTGSVTET